MDGIEIRPCRLEECPTVLELWRHADTRSSVTDSVGILEDLVRDHGERFLVAVRDGRIVGSVFAGWDGWRGHIYRLAVDPPERRRGLGRYLVAEAERTLGQLGVRRLAITAAGDDNRAARFWHALAAEGWEHDRHAIRFTKNLR